MRPAFTCGVRTTSPYVCERPVEDGSPLEHFLPCPPIRVDMQALRLTAIGMRIIERVDPSGIPMGVFDLWDYVGEEDNPHVTDFLEQTRYLGTSRKMSTTLIKDPHFKDLKPHPYDPSLSSRHVYVHHKGYIVDPFRLYQNRTGIKTCPKGIFEHDANQAIWEPCVALHWEAVDDLPADVENRRHKLLMPKDWEKYGAPSFSYVADYLPRGVSLEYDYGVIMTIPLMHIEIPRDSSGDDEHERYRKLLEDGGWQYRYEITED